jgi:uncharacterized protein
MRPSRFAGLPSYPASPDSIAIEARSFRSRLLGLAFLDADELPPGTGLLLPRCTSIHTFGMRFPIDAAFLDGQGRVIREIHDVPSRRIRSCRGAAACLEVHAGELSRFLRRPIRPGG